MISTPYVLVFTLLFSSLTLCLLLQYVQTLNSVAYWHELWSVLHLRLALNLQAELQDSFPLPQWKVVCSKDYINNTQGYISFCKCVNCIPTSLKISPFMEYNFYTYQHLANASTLTCQQFFYASFLLNQFLADI